MSIAFVAGATGYTGRAVVHALAQAGIETHAHVRPDSKRLSEWTEQFTLWGAQIDTTPWDQEVMTKRLSELNPNAVFGCLGTTKKRIAQDAVQGEASSYQIVDYGMTVMLHQAAQSCSSSPRFVYVSSAGSKPGGQGSYLGARYAVEQTLIQSELPYTIARPSFITGPGRDEDRPAERLRGGFALERHFKSDEETHVVLLGSYVPRPRPSEPFVTPDPQPHRRKGIRMGAWEKDRDQKGPAFLFSRHGVARLPAAQI